MTPEKTPDAPSLKPPSSETVATSPLTAAPLGNERVLSFLGHELRNPLAAIVMAAEALSRLCADAPDKKALTDVIYRQAWQANRLLEDVLDVSRIASGRMELHSDRIDLVEQIRNLITTRPAVDAVHARPQAQLPDGPIWVEADAARLAQALGNLLDHAVQSAQKDDVLVVAAGLEDGGREAFIEIPDHGLGVEPASLAAIFEPFGQRRGDSRHGRSGLEIGLAVAKGLIELQGGRVTAESAGVGNGGCFRIHWPVAIPPTGQQDDAGTPQNVSRALHLLIIEDSPDVITSLRFLLNGSGHTLSVAAGGAEGIEAARRLRPDVVLCDIGLPDIDGYSVAQALRADATTAKRYLIAMSGYNSPEDQRRSLAAGFDLHLNKPDGFVGLNERLRTIPIGGD
jgi:CheY-like chemotaxis protein